MVDSFALVQERLTHPRVIIDNRDVERAIEEYDSPTTLHYVDLPYIGAERYYVTDIRKRTQKLFDHRHLAELLNAVKGFVALSYYPHPDLALWYPREQWWRLTWQVQKVSSIHAEKLAAVQFTTEMLLMNYPTILPSLWEKIESGG